MHFPLHARAIAKRVLKDHCEIVDGPQSGTGVLNRATGAVEFPDSAIRYEGPCSLTDHRPTRQQPGGSTVESIDETLFRISADQQATIAVGMVARVKSADPGGVEWAEYTIIRIPSRSHELSTQFYAERRVARPTAAGAE